MLQTCHGNLKDLNMEPRLQNMLIEAGLPEEVDDIDSDDDQSSLHIPCPPLNDETSPDPYDAWLHSGTGFTTYLNRGLHIEGDSQVNYNM